jgi:hypothetical protein
LEKLEIDILKGKEGLEGCEMSRRPQFLNNRLIPQFLDNQLTDDGEVVSLTLRLSFRTPLPIQEDSWYSHLLEAESTPGP